MKNILKSLLILCVLLAVTSCVEPEVIGPPERTSSIHDSLQLKFSNSFQYFEVNGTTGGDLISEKGIQFHIPEYTFRDLNGDTIFGPVKVNLVEVRDPQEMILLNKPSTANNQIINSGGHFKLSFKVNNNPVFISEDTLIHVKVPATTVNNDMFIFDGIVDATTYVDWSPALDELGQYRPTNNTTEVVNGLVQNYDSLTLDYNSSEWISYGKFIDNTTSQTALTFHLPQYHDNTNTLFYIHFNNSESVIAGYFDGDNFVTPATIPFGAEVTAVFISEYDKNYYSNFINMNVSNGFSADIAMNPTTYIRFN